MAVTPKGVRMINDNVIQDGLGLVVNKRDAMDWNHIPNGSLYINPDTGVMMMKVAGETDWIPAGIKNDGTLVISRDTSLHVEVFTIKTLDNGDGTFTYLNSDGEQRYKSNENGLLFQLEHGTYLPGRNHLTIIYDDVLERSAASGGIEEIDETRFRITEPIPVGTEITVKYIKWVRIGNPYPRWYEAYDEPTEAEVGDFFLDLDDNVEDLFGTIGQTDPSQETGNISWSRITGRPTTLSGYGIRDAASKVHTHEVGDITGIANYVDTRATNVITAKMGPAIDAKITTFQSKLTNGTVVVAKATNATNAEKIVVGNTTYNVDTTKAGGAAAANKIVVYDANGKIPAAALPKIESFVVGMIIDWFGASNQVPTGWAICDGRTVNGVQTPDLTGKFIIGGGTAGSYVGCATIANTTAANTKYNGGNTTGEATGTATIAERNLPPHSHTRGTMNITGSFWSLKNNDAVDAFYKSGSTGGWSNRGGASDSVEINFDASRSWTGNTSIWGGNANGEADPLTVTMSNIMPPYVALFKIMYVGA